MEEPKGPDLTAADLAAGLWLLGACLLTRGSTAAVGKPETQQTAPA